MGGKNYYIFFDNLPGKDAKVGRGFYYENYEKNLYLRFAVFDKGNLLALVSSKHSLKKIKQLLSKPKPLLINRCCGFKVLETNFRVTKHGVKSHFQISTDRGLTFNDYHLGKSKIIDSIFKAAAQDSENLGPNWSICDFAEIFEPNFKIRKATEKSNLGVFKVSGFARNNL